MVRAVKISEEGKKLAEQALKDSDRTQITLAKEIQLGRTTVNYFFNNKPIYVKNFQKICEALQLDWRQISNISHEEQSVNVNFQTVSAPIRVNKPKVWSKSKPDDKRVIIHNLPPKSYTKYVGRDTELQKLQRLLSFNDNARIISVQGIGGVGKTSFILEAVYSYLKHSQENSSSEPFFEAIIFTSAKEEILANDKIYQKKNIKQVKRNLQDIFEEISIVLDEPNIIQKDHRDFSDKTRNSSLLNQYEIVYETLNNRYILLIIDNIETIEDLEEVMSFVKELPATVKTVITTRELIIDTIPISLSPLKRNNTKKLIQHLAQEKGFSLSDEEIRKIKQKTQGLPIAIIYIIGQIYAGYTLDSVIKNLTKKTENISRFCFESSVKNIENTPAYKLLLAAAIFQDPPLEESIAEVAGLLPESKDDVEENMARLQQLLLIQRVGDRYKMLRLTRQYALDELNKTSNSEFKEEALQRWIKKCLDFTEKYGKQSLGEKTPRLDILQKNWRNLLDALEWCKKKNHYQNFKQLWENLNDYAHIYGYWIRRRELLQWLIEKSQEQEDDLTKIEAYKNMAFTLIHQGGEENYKLTQEYLNTAWQYCQNPKIEDDHEKIIILKADIADHMSLLLIKQEKYEEALKWLKICRENVAKIKQEECLIIREIGIDKNLSEIYYKETQYTKAKDVYLEIKKKAEQINWQMMINFAEDKLSKIALKNESQLQETENLVEKGLAKAENDEDEQQIASFHVSSALIQKKHDKTNEAREHAEEALFIYKNLEMYPETEEVQNLLNEIDKNSEL